MKTKTFVKKLPTVSPESEAAQNHRRSVQEVLRPLIEEQAKREANSWQRAHTWPR